MNAEEMLNTFHGPAGYLGPVGLGKRWQSGEQAEAGKVMVMMDLALEGRHNLVAGANRQEYHLRNVTPGEGLSSYPDADIRNVVERGKCPVPGLPAAR